ncbi:MAG: hypothetical protein M1541_14780, partial [Acidobacteria bacterium]|nr:hypothetical protein [Acidobacteriota bacterium]
MTTAAEGFSAAVPVAGKRPGVSITAAETFAGAVIRVTAKRPAVSAAVAEAFSATVAVAAKR